mmetsp:Transcript_79733/g.140647  ORF Transcript_79733/g.140647 Transcript_79733/m.140647 type:complete len:205 (-) Transcript_79733:2547-3161(-)
MVGTLQVSSRRLLLQAAHENIVSAVVAALEALNRVPQLPGVSVQGEAPNVEGPKRRQDFQLQRIPLAVDQALGLRLPFPDGLQRLDQCPNLRPIHKPLRGGAGRHPPVNGSRPLLDQQLPLPILKRGPAGSALAVHAANLSNAYRAVDVAASRDDCLPPLKLIKADGALWQGGAAAQLPQRAVEVGNRGRDLLHLPLRHIQLVQ